MNRQFNQKAVNQFRKELEAMMDDIKGVDEKVLNRAMNEGMRAVKLLTPVGVYKDRTGGALRRNWSRTRVFRTSTYVTVTLYNNTEYGPYVNYGHRVVNKSGETIGWVKGRFFLEKAIYKMERSMIREFKKEIERVNSKHGK